MLKVLGEQHALGAFPRYTSNYAGVTWEHETGALDDLRNDVGIAEMPAGPIIMASLAYNSTDHQWTVDNTSLLALARLARPTLAHFLPQQTAAGTAK